MAKVHIGSEKDKKSWYNLNDLTKHAAIVGTTGSGKTVMCKILVEEALKQGIPVIAIDPKGDIGSLGIVHKEFDFRPYARLNKRSATSLAKKYVDNLQASEVNVKDSIDGLQGTDTYIFTPKSSYGHQISLMPKLHAPNNFEKLSERDPMIIANFVEPVSESLIRLAGIKGELKEKAKSLISSLLIHNWDEKVNVKIELLIEQIINPPFDKIGSMPLDDFFKEKDRKKIASLINLLISSPSKKAWSQGNNLDIEKLFTRGKLSVFDLRFVSGIEEKQFVAEQIMQEIYRFLLEKGGSEKLKYILYFDELAGFLPPAPASPPSKKLLELLVRQGRAFGLGIIVATQNPGDIDYKVFGNVGTRFIGKLRTSNDIEKVAIGTDMSITELKNYISGIKTGEFVFNNAIDNKTKKIKSRWLITYHGGPINPVEIEWINDAATRPLVKEKLGLDMFKLKVKKKIIKKQAKTTVKKIKKSKILPKLISDVKKYSDIVKIRRGVSDQNKYAPHLRIVIEPEKLKGLKLKMQGPFFFDLTTKIIPLDNYLKSISWSQSIPDTIEIIKPKRTIKQTVQYALRTAKKDLMKNYYESTIIDMRRELPDKIELMNFEHLMQVVKPRILSVQKKYSSLNKTFESKIKLNNSKISELRKKLLKQKTKRLVKKVITKKKILNNTKEMRERKAKIKLLQKENDKYKKKISANKKKSTDEINKITQQTRKKAKSCIKKYIYKPTDKNLIVHATIMLVPVKRI